LLWRCRHSLIRARSPLIPRGTRGVTGQFDHLPLPLPYKIEDGLGNFLPPPALESVAMDYQLGLLARLTEEVRNTEDEDSSVAQVVINTAPYREKTLAFNYASLALNNSFFLSHLTPDPEDSREDVISAQLKHAIRSDHGGLDNFKSTVSAAAMGMFTSGYVWFVCDRAGVTSILPTFGPGTLLVRSRTYMSQAHPDFYRHEVPTDPLAWARDVQYMDKYLEGWNADGPPSFLDPRQMGPLLDETMSEEEWAKKLEGWTKEQESGKQDEEGDAMLASLLAETRDEKQAKQLSEALDKRRRNRATPTSGPTPVRPRFLHTSAHRFNNRPMYPESSRRSTFEGTPSGLYAGDLTRRSPKTKADALHAGEVLFPLFCVAVQEHAWITAGYGVWGKEAWLREFWSVLNWRQVSESYDKIRASSG
ncbi:hypothetical protein FB451DRAFT_1204931, partial [Mycena latifolia]